MERSPIITLLFHLRIIGKQCISNSYIYFDFCLESFFFLRPNESIDYIRLEFCVYRI